MCTDQGLGYYALECVLCMLDQGDQNIKLSIGELITDPGFHIFQGPWKVTLVAAGMVLESLMKMKAHIK